MPQRARPPHILAIWKTGTGCATDIAQTIPALAAPVAKVLGQARLEVDSVDALYHFACKNLGATVLPEHLAARGETEGKLSRLFPDWRLKPLGIFAVWPDTSRRENLTLLFVRFLAKELHQ